MFEQDRVVREEMVELRYLKKEKNVLHPESAVHHGKETPPQQQRRLEQLKK